MALWAGWERNFCSLQREKLSLREGQDFLKVTQPPREESRICTPCQGGCAWGLTPLACPQAGQAEGSQCCPSCQLWESVLRTARTKDKAISHPHLAHLGSLTGIGILGQEVLDRQGPGTSRSSLQGHLLGSSENWGKARPTSQNCHEGQTRDG